MRIYLLVLLPHASPGDSSTENEVDGADDLVSNSIDSANFDASQLLLFSANDTNMRVPYGLSDHFAGGTQVNTSKSCFKSNR